MPKLNGKTPLVTRKFNRLKLIAVSEIVAQVGLEPTPAGFHPTVLHYTTEPIAQPGLEPGPLSRLGTVRCITPLGMPAKELHLGHFS